MYWLELSICFIGLSEILEEGICYWIDFVFLNQILFSYNWLPNQADAEITVTILVNMAGHF